jgi:CRISPR/Cas system-associated exonuclease Cas4 (RecB family)
MDETGNILRPDRVIIKKSEVIVVDFKFGKEEHSGYLRQVKEYMTVLASAGYTNIRGYVWYPLLKVHREVE